MSTLPDSKVARAHSDRKATNQLTGTLDELKEIKGGLVAYLFLSGKERDAIAKELGDTFKLPDAQALKITRRITAASASASACSNS